MAQEININRGGVSGATLLGLLFVAAKLWGVIDWSWWLVLMPFWLVPVVLLTVAVFCGLIALAVAADDRRKKARWSSR